MYPKKKINVIPTSTLFNFKVFFAPNKMAIIVFIVIFKKY